MTKTTTEPISLHRFWPSQFAIGSCGECGRAKESSVHWVAEVARERCPICGGLNPGDSSHVRCM